MTKIRTGGRPVDTSAAPKLMQAARDLFRAHGYEAVSIAMIADAAGVGRQTVYRRWRSKADLALDAYLERAETTFAVPDGPIAAMLETMLMQNLATFEEDRTALRSLIASAQSDDVFRATFSERLSTPVDHAITRILEQAITRGELAPGLDAAMLSETIHGAIWYRLLLGRPLDADFIRRLTATAVRDSLTG